MRSRPSAKRFQATAASALAVALPSAVANAANPSPRPGNRVRDARLRTRQTQGFVPLQAASNLGALRRAHGCQGNIEIYLFMFKLVSRLLFKTQKRCARRRAVRVREAACKAHAGRSSKNARKEQAACPQVLACTGSQARPGVFLTKKRFELDFRGTRFPHPVFGSNPVHCRTRLFAVKDRVYAARPAQEAGSKRIEWLKELAMSTTSCLHAVRLFDPITLSPS